ncbi:MAG: phage holin family protein [Chloroflexota bacterium]
MQENNRQEQAAGEQASHIAEETQHRAENLADQAVHRLGESNTVRHTINRLTRPFRRGVEEAREEAEETAIRIGTGAALVGAGALMLYTALPAATVALIYVLNPRLSARSGALALAALYSLGGAALAYVGLRALNIDIIEVED